MTVVLCFLLPSVLLMYIRDKVLGNNIACGFRGGVKDFLREYLLTVCLLNFVVISITYVVFDHESSLDASLREGTGFVFRYLLLSLAIAMAEPFAENLLRYHIKINIGRIKVRYNRNLVLYVYAFVLFAMNFIRIFDNAFWGDEGYSIGLAQMSVPNMIATTAADVHPPLHYLLTQLLYHVFGNNGVAYHLSGLVPYAGIMIVGCTSVKKRFGIIPSAILVTMASLMKNAVTYNVEARMYSLASLMVLVAYIAFYEIIKENNLKSWVVFCIASLGAAYTHYYALISVAFLYAMIIPLAIFRKKYRKAMLIAYAVTILSYLPWLMILVKSFARTANNWWLESIPTIMGCYYFLLDYKWMIVGVLVCLALFVIYQIKFLNISISNSGMLKDRLNINIHMPEKLEISDELYWVISGVVSICGMVAVGLGLSYMIRPFFVTRYMFSVSAMLYLIIGFCVSRMKFRNLWSLVLVLAILWSNVPAYAQKYNADYKLNNDTNKFLQAVTPDSSVELVTNNSHLGWTLLCYYYPENVSKYDENAPMQLDTSYEDIWLIWQGELDEAAEASIREQNYACTKTYEGAFANGAYYRVYQLQRIK